MLKRIFHARIARFERAYDYDATYMHALVDFDPRGFLKFASIARAGEYRAGLPAAAFFAAKLAATLHEDCGPCAQLVVNLALAAGVAPATLEALARGDLAYAGDDAALAFRFAQAVLRNDADLATLRDAVTARFGARGPAFLGIAVVVARMFPVLKRAMGHAQACVRLKVGPAMVSRGPVHAAGEQAAA